LLLEGLVWRGRRSTGLASRGSALDSTLTSLLFDELSKMEIQAYYPASPLRDMLEQPLTPAASSQRTMSASSHASCPSHHISLIASHHPSWICLQPRLLSPSANQVTQHVEDRIFNSAFTGQEASTTYSSPQRWSSPQQALQSPIEQRRWPSSSPTSGT
jgi:hypothetical protein